jgi:hypothetical protein
MSTVESQSSRTYAWVAGALMVLLVIYGVLTLAGVFH